MGKCQVGTLTHGVCEVCVGTLGLFVCGQNEWNGCRRQGLRIARLHWNVRLGKSKDKSMLRLVWILGVGPCEVH